MEMVASLSFFTYVGIALGLLLLFLIFKLINVLYDRNSSEFPFGRLRNYKIF